MDAISVIIIIAIIIYIIKKPSSDYYRKDEVDGAYSGDNGKKSDYRRVATPEKNERNIFFWRMMNEGVVIKRKGCFLTRSEAIFFKNLTEWFGESYNIHCQVSLGQLIFLPKMGRDESEYRRFYAILNNMALDYVLVSKETNKVVCVIELDDDTHQRPDRIERDKKLNKVLLLAKVNFLRVPVNNINVEPEILEGRKL